MAKPFSPLLSICSLIAILVAVFFPLSHVKADSWPLPETETVLSPDGQFRFTVQPAPIDSAMQYFQEEIEASEAGTKVERPASLGMLEMRDQSGDWQPVWAIKLVNPVAPVSVLVADDGEHIVTFDNWHSVGLGDHVIVIYGEGGSLVRSLALNDFLPQDYIDALPRSVSSLQWRTASAIKAPEDRLTVDVLVPGDSEEELAVTFTINLQSGEVSPPKSEEWDRATALATTINEGHRLAAERRLAYLREPLLPPDSCELRDWHGYLREAHMRLAPNWLDSPFTSTTVIYPADHERHEESIQWLRDDFLDEFGDVRAGSIASPCDHSALAKAIADIVRLVEPGALTDATFYISIGAQYMQDVRLLVESRGANFVWLDPETPIPQRPERIPGSTEEREAEEERARRRQAEMQDMMSEIDF